MEAQLDAILEAYSQDHPDRLKFQRVDGKVDAVELAAEWSHKLIGKAKEALKRKVSFPIPEQVRRPFGSQPSAPRRRKAQGAAD